MNNRGQFSIIAAMFVAVILVSSVVATYSAIRYGAVEEQPQILSAIDETNLGLKQVLGFTVGYYGSVLQVTGNSTYARESASRYLSSGLENVAAARPEWGSSFTVTDLALSTTWFMNESFSKGSVTVNYDLTGIGVTGITYSATCELDVQVSESPYNGKACLTVFKDGNEASAGSEPTGEPEPLSSLNRLNFKFYLYLYSNLTWETVVPETEPLAFTNGTYLIDVPEGINPLAFSVQVQDTRGIMVAASSFSHYTGTLRFNTTFEHDDNYVDFDNSTVDAIDSRGTHSDFPAQQQAPDGVYDTLTEANVDTATHDYFPDSYTPIGGTALYDGDLTDLQTNNNINMTFQAYPSEFSGSSEFGYHIKGFSSASILNTIRGSLFTASQGGIAQDISAYIHLTSSSQTFGYSGTGSTASIENTIRGSRFAPSYDGIGSSISAYIDLQPTVFGETNQYSSYNDIENIIRGSSFTCPESGTVQSITAYIYTSTSRTMKAAIYNNDATHTLVQQTQERSVDTGYVFSWITFNFTTPPSLVGGNSYVLVVWSSSAYGSAYLGSHTGATNQGHSLSRTYGTWPSSLGSSPSHNSVEYSIYCTFTVPSRNVKAAIYSDVHSIVGTTEEQTVSTDGWVTFDFLYPYPTLAAGTNYILVVWSDDSSGDVYIRYHTGLSYQGHSLTLTYGSWPSSAGFSHNSNEYAIYCTYSISASVKAAIYSSSHSFIAGTNEQAVFSDGWVTFSFAEPKPVLVEGAAYVLVVWAENSAGGVEIYYDGGSTYQGHSVSATYGSWPEYPSFSHNTNKYSIYCSYLVVSEYSCEVEFGGEPSNVNEWNNLKWTMESSCTTTLDVTFQLFNYTLGDYAQSSYGYLADTINSGGKTSEQTITANDILQIDPSDFRDSTGRWQLRFRAVKSTSASFTVSFDFIKFTPGSAIYGLDLEEQWANVSIAHQPELCIKTGTLGGSDGLEVDVWHNITGSEHWDNLCVLTIENGWHNVSVAQYQVGSTFTIRFNSTNAADTSKSTWQIDAVLLRSESDQTLFRSLQDAVVEVELLQNGTMRWFGQNLRQLEPGGGDIAEGIPIPPIPVKAIHVNQTTVTGREEEVPFQVEDWASEYTVPMGLTNNATVFGNRQMIVFLVNTQLAKFTVWWNGSDEASQTPLAFTERYFTADNPSDGLITNGNLSAQFGSGFTVTSTVGTSQSVTNFMRINTNASVYGSGTSYVIVHGIVRDVVQQESEWSGGAGVLPNGTVTCENIYANNVLTFPANATYFTYQERLMFTNTARDRYIWDLCPLKLSSSLTAIQTENGTLLVDPLNVSVSGTFYNYNHPALPGTPHHWSQFIEGTKGAGIMFTDSANQRLYAFDSATGGSAGATGALVTNNSTHTIELLPITRRAVYPFKSAFDVTWKGAVVTFDGGNPIFKVDASGRKTGLWILTELSPMVSVETNR
ncbi:MAG: hypothetical protein ACE14S_02350 [Candidatus Bathyarchaeia archaeon]